MASQQNTHEVLSFHVVDDITNVSPEQISLAEKALHQMTSEQIGPLVEYLLLRKLHPHLPSLATLNQSEVLSVLKHFTEDRHFPPNLSLNANSVEFLPTPRCVADVARPEWTAYCKRLEEAGKRAGFPSLTAQGIVGAFREMTDNVLLHSECPATGVSGYRWTPGELEYVVADSGVGVLASLRTCPEYQHVTDSGQALLIALSEGATRYGHGSGHGTGFAQVFVSLANLFGSLRFRSGNHSLEIEGISPSLPVAQLRQRANIAGLLVSVCCRSRRT